MRPTSTPMPVGPSILWPVNAKKSQPMAGTSTGMWGTLCEPSTTTSAPCSWARRVISATGLSVPSTLLTCTTPTMRVRSDSRLAEGVHVELALRR